jgi:hypothetical protein
MYFYEIFPSETCIWIGGLCFPLSFSILKMRRNLKFEIKHVGPRKEDGMYYKWMTFFDNKKSLGLYLFFFPAPKFFWIFHFWDVTWMKPMPLLILSYITTDQEPPTKLNIFFWVQYCRRELETYNKSGPQARWDIYT